PDHMMFEMWNPHGIVGVITAFNFPYAVLGESLYSHLVGIYLMECTYYISLRQLCCLVSLSNVELLINFSNTSSFSHFVS
ncbi:hypothetical protein GIB67_003457, partial [Kingdonia uniflora]